MQGWVAGSQAGSWRRSSAWTGSSLLVWCSFGQVVMAGRAGRLPAPSVLLSAWSMSVRRRGEAWERYRRSPYCHSSLLWQGGADQGACGVAVGEDPGRRLLGAGSRGPRRSMGLLWPDLGPVLPGADGSWRRSLGPAGRRPASGRF